MYGLLMRSHMTAGQDGFRDASSKQRSDLCGATVFTGVSRVVDRSITPSAVYLASSGLNAARLLLYLLPVPAKLYAAPIMADAAGLL